jgi:glycosyltransferase involved in cell wall biosynthesis
MPGNARTDQEIPRTQLALDDHSILQLAVVAWRRKDTMSELPHPMGFPKVTIAIPTLNRVGYLRLALESALGQSYGNIEVVVSNNASTDDTASYLASCNDPRLRVLQQTKLLPMAENWNACVAAATGEYFLLLSDDDLLEPDAIQELVAGYAEQDGHPAPGIVYCGGRYIDAVGGVTRVFRQSPPREAARDLILACFDGKRDLCFCAVLLRTADLLPGFPTTYKVACDFAVWMRAAMRRGPAVFIPKQLVRFRVHQSLSFATWIDVWRAEYRQIHKLAIAEDKRAGGSDPVFVKHMRSSVQRAERCLIVSRIDESLRTHKGRALLEYGRNLSAFCSPLGLLSLGKGIVKLFLNDQSRMWLRQRLRKGPASFQSE